MNTINCLTNLVGLKSICDANGETPLFYLDQLEGISSEVLAKLANVDDHTGTALANRLIANAMNEFEADLQTIQPKGYNFLNTIDNLCDVCSFTGLYHLSQKGQKGILINNISRSENSKIQISNLQVVINSSGTFPFFIDDGVDKKEYTHDFTAGELTSFKLNYTTFQKDVKIYFEEDVIHSQINCTEEGCGCTGSSSNAASSNKISISGWNNGKSSEHYSFIPCITIVCDSSTLVCSLVQTMPKIIGLALLYLTASKLFTEDAKSLRINQVTLDDQEDKESYSDYYYQLYRERVYGSSKVKGIVDLIKQNMGTIAKHDDCIECVSVIRKAWATT